MARVSKKDSLSGRIAETAAMHVCGCGCVCGVGSGGNQGHIGHVLANLPDSQPFFDVGTDTCKCEDHLDLDRDAGGAHMNRAQIEKPSLLPCPPGCCPISSMTPTCVFLFGACAGLPTLRKRAPAIPLPSPVMAAVTERSARFVRVRRPLKRVCCWSPLGGPRRAAPNGSNQRLDECRKFRRSIDMVRREKRTSV